jgi:broad specificity phosphatase PhoE/ribonuclease HI
VTSRVILEADGGSRGNPGPAAYGALIRDADTGRVIAERGETIGVATNNVAEYGGLVAGLELYAEHTPDAELEVRMDSKLVIEQMAGRWKVKHPSMVPLAQKARRLAPAGTTWTWVPRAQNGAADALVNAALDGRTEKASATGWGAASGTATTLVMLRHGVTAATERKAFSGSGGDDDPELTETGREQARKAAAWLAERTSIDAIVASPMLRTRETAAAAADVLGLPVEIDEGLIETAFGDWDGHTFAEIQQRWGDEVTAWLADSTVAPPGGESMDTVFEVSHVTPIKMLVRLALDAPMSVIYKMELSPASITTAQWWPDGPASLRNFNIVP